MRTRKYRGYSNLIGHPSGMAYGSGCFIDQSEKHYVISDETGKPDFIQVEEIEDWTGLLDKNDREIYEGDIVKTADEFGQVKYDSQQASFIILFLPHNKNKKNGCANLGSTWPSPQKEVLGNLYENPNLLTQHNSEV